jgi:hypothetical protein
MKSQQRLALTIGAILFYYLLSLIPLYHYPEVSFSNMSNPTIGLFALGLAPIYSGFVIVEIISFLINPLKKWRTQGMAGRVKIHRVQLVLVILIAIFQGWGTGQLINSYSSDHPLAILGITGLPAQIILCSCLVDGVLIAYLLASNVTQFGLVNGFILFLFARHLVSKMTGLFKGIQMDLRLFKTNGYFLGIPTDFHFSNFDEKMNFIYFLFIIVGIGFVLFQKRNRILDLIYKYLLRNPIVTYQAKEKSYQVKTSPIPQTTMGGFGILTMILQLVWFHNGILSGDGILRNVLWVGAEVIDLGVTSYLFWLLYTNTYWVDYHLEGRAAWVPNRDKLKPYFVFWLVLSVFGIFVNESSLFFHLSFTIEKVSQIVLEPVFILTIVILGIEIIEKLKFDHKVNQYVCLAEMDNVELVQLWVAQLEEANIPFHVEGLRYRQITQFFAPFLKMMLFVDERHAEEVMNTIRLEDVQQI